MARFILGLLLTFVTMGGVGWYYTEYLPHKSLDLPDPDESAPIIIDEVTKLDIQQMLRNKDYDTLNKVLAKAQKNFLDDYSQENMLLDLYDAFESHDSSFEGLLAEWRTQYPDKYQPYLASAFYYDYIGWESRGYKLRKDTKKEQFDKMYENLKKADENIDKAIHINSKLLPAYYLEIIISNAVGDYKSTPYQFLTKTLKTLTPGTFIDINGTRERAYQYALQITPYTFRIRSVYMMGLEPRWGGSYESMDKFAAAAQKYADVNPKLNVLKGFSSLDKAQITEGKDDLENALNLIDHALSYGDYSEFYSERAEIYFYLRNIKGSVDDINRAIELSPYNENLYIQRAMTYYVLREVKAAIADLAVAESIKPDNGLTMKSRDWVLDKLAKDANASYREGLYEKSIEQYELILTVGASKYYDLYYWQGLAYMNLGDYSHATQKLQIAADVFPNNYEYHITLDKALTRSRSWDPLITAWGGYIAVSPNDSNGYMQRCTAYLHKGDYESAMQDAKQAADLGSAEGQTKYEQIVKKLGK